MQSLLGLLFFIAGESFVYAEPALVTLQLGKVPDENNIDLTLSAFSFSSSRTSIYSGSIDAELVIDLETDLVTTFQMTGGSITASNVSYLFESPGFFSQTIDLIDYRAVPKSLSGSESLATPGIFDATQHVFHFNQGRTISAGTFGTSESLVRDGPFDALGVTTGSLTLDGRQTISSSITGENIAIQYDLAFSVSLDSQNFPNPQDPETFVQTMGTVTAQGQTLVYLHPFFAWAVKNAPEAGTAISFSADANHDGISDGLSWALGENTGSRKTAPLRFNPISQKFELHLPESGTRAPIIIQLSSDLSPNSWTIIDPAKVSLGVNPLPPETTGTISISRTSLSPQFFRLITTRP